ncbi:Uncharacterised protein [[Ruminococcus] torques]|uniref:Uncharacterized protein n=1 Tax=[Ruminococcus] torques TaxID=33039 RepID=A0A564T5Q8_9FIRM|nr:Uncharacterised protein [[Ruminococcus] torques]
MRRIYADFDENGDVGRSRREVTDGKKQKQENRD